MKTTNLLLRAFAVCIACCALYPILWLNRNLPSQTTVPAHTKVFVLMTEPRCIPSIPYVLENALNETTFDVVLFYSKHNAHCIDEWVNDTKSILYQAHVTNRLHLNLHSNMDPYVKDVYKPHSWNNVLYTDAEFWKSLYKYGDVALTIQSDTLICSNASRQEPLWNNIDFLGGVSSYINTRKTNLDSPSSKYHMNGGLSIRNLDWVIKCIAQTPAQDFRKFVEDAVFNNCTHSSALVQAMMFASDGGFTKCFDYNSKRVCPYGVHKPWMYTHGNYMELVHHCPSILKLQRLASFAKHQPKSAAA